MAAELVTPWDEATGIPLSIAPDIPGIESMPNDNTWHHLFHPSTDPVLQTLGGRALRSSRVQLLPGMQHNFGAHNYHTLFKGPQLPTDETKQFELCVFSAAGYLPDKVIDISQTDDFAIRPMTETERSFFRKVPVPEVVNKHEVTHLREKLLAAEVADGEASGISMRAVRRILEQRNQTQAELSVNGLRYAYMPMRDFFIEYLRRPEVLDVRPRFVKKFLTAKDRDKQMMGEVLLERVSVVASSSLLPVYRQAHKEGKLNARMQPVPFELVRDKLGNPQQRAQLLPLFAERLDAIIGNVPLTSVA